MKKIAFLHIPKTAGSSLYEALLKGRKGARFTNGDIADFNTYMSIDLDRHSLISGHLQMHHLLRRDLQGWRFITVLRDPIEREISTYRYLISSPYHPLYKRFKGVTFEKFVEMTSDARNLQCRFFSGKPDADAAIEIIEKRFDLVGTVENMPLFMDYLERIDGPLDLRIVNKSKGAGVAVSESLRDRLHEELAEDYRLFNYARPVWASRWIRSQPPLKPSPFPHAQQRQAYR